MIRYAGGTISSSSLRRCSCLDGRRALCSVGGVAGEFLAAESARWGSGLLLAYVARIGAAVECRAFHEGKPVEPEEVPVAWQQLVGECTRLISIPNRALHWWRIPAGRGALRRSAAASRARIECRRAARCGIDPGGSSTVLSGPRSKFRSGSLVGRWGRRRDSARIVDTGTGGGALLGVVLQEIQV